MNLETLASRLQGLQLEQSNYLIVPTQGRGNVFDLLLVRNRSRKVMKYQIHLDRGVSRFVMYSSPTFDEMTFFINFLDQLKFDNIPDVELTWEDLGKFTGFKSKKIYYPTQLSFYLKAVLESLNILMIHHFESVFNTHAKEDGVVPKSWKLRMTKDSSFVITNSKGLILLEVMTGLRFIEKGIKVKIRVQSAGKSLKSLRKFFESLPSKDFEKYRLNCNPELKAVMCEFDMVGNTPLTLSLTPFLSTSYQYAVLEQTKNNIDLNF